MLGMTSVLTAEEDLSPSNGFAGGAFAADSKFQVKPCFIAGFLPYF